MKDGTGKVKNLIQNCIQTVTLLKRYKKARRRYGGLYSLTDLWIS